MSLRPTIVSERRTASPAIGPWQAEFKKIRRNGTDAEIDVFEGLPHGFGLGEGTAAEGWIDHAVSFWERQMK